MWPEREDRDLHLFKCSLMEGRASGRREWVVDEARYCQLQLLRRIQGKQRPGTLEFRIILQFL